MPQGGSYKSVRDTNIGGEVHHMPADSVSHLNRDEGPAIWMETIEHQQTASWGRLRSAITYRRQQQALIQQGQFLTAQQLDIDDIHTKFGDKYDTAIAEMLEYTQTIDAKLTPPTAPSP
jgi:hypothetical protein